MPTRKYKTTRLAAAHALASELAGAGVVSKKTMRDLDTICFTPVKTLTPSQIASLRKREDASQAIFAHHLGVSANLISQWERGEKKPSGSSLKLLTLVEKNGLDWVA